MRFLDLARCSQSNLSTIVFDAPGARSGSVSSTLLGSSVTNPRGVMYTAWERPFRTPHPRGMVRGMHSTRYILCKHNIPCHIMPHTSHMQCPGVQRACVALASLLTTLRMPGHADQERDIFQSWRVFVLQGQHRPQPSHHR